MLEEKEESEETSFPELLFRIIAEEWLESYSKIYHSDSRYQGNVNRLNTYIYDYFSGSFAGKITQKDVLKFLGMMKTKEGMTRRKSSYNPSEYI